MRPQIGYYDEVVQEAAAMMESLAMNHPPSSTATSGSPSPSRMPS